MTTPIPSAQESGEKVLENAFPFCGDIDIHIKSNGQWFHEGSPIGRAKLVNLFSTVLRRDVDGDFWLQTPAERARIKVDDAPWIAIEVLEEEAGLSLRLNIDKVIPLGPENPLRVETNPETGEPSPYIKVKDGDGAFPLEARLARSVFYDLVNRGEEMMIDGSQHLVVRSRGSVQSLGKLEET